MRELKIEKLGGRVKLDKEVLEEIKALGLRSRLKAFKSEGVKCPKAGEKVPFAQCFVCEYFVRRVKGVVHCRY